MRVYLRAKFEVSSITLTIFRQTEVVGGAVILPAPLPSITSKRTHKKPIQIRVK